MVINASRNARPTCASHTCFSSRLIVQNISSATNKHIPIIEMMNLIWTDRRSAYQPCAFAKHRAASVKADCKSSCLLIVKAKRRIEKTDQNIRCPLNGLKRTSAANTLAAKYKATVTHPITVGSPICGDHLAKTQSASSVGLKACSSVTLS